MAYLFTGLTMSFQIRIVMYLLILPVLTPSYILLLVSYRYLLYSWRLPIIFSCFRVLKKLKNKGNEGYSRKLICYLNNFLATYPQIYFILFIYFLMGCHCEVASLQTKAIYMKLCDFAQTAIGNWISWESFCYLHLPWPTYTFLSSVLFYSFSYFCPSCF